jgi:hypothetical protein
MPATGGAGGPAHVASHRRGARGHTGRRYDPGQYALASQSVRDRGGGAARPHTGPPGPGAPPLRSAVRKGVARVSEILEIEVAKALKGCPRAASLPCGHVDCNDIHCEHGEKYGRKQGDG